MTSLNSGNIQKVLFCDQKVAKLRNDGTSIPKSSWKQASWGERGGCEMAIKEEKNTKRSSEIWREKT